MPITIAKLLVEIGANSDAARAELTSIGGELQGYGDKMMRTGALMTAGLSVPLTMLGKKVTDLARDYQENMNVLGAVTNATGAQFTQMGDLAQELGADLKLPGTSAGDAASAMVELGKAGLSVADVMGAARGVLQLSAAGGLENAVAAEVAANALNAFGLAGTEATRVADLLAAGANTSSAEVTDMAAGFQQAAAVFSASGRSIEDLTAMLAMMANMGIKNSDAGTSLKSMMMGLQSPTKEATRLMEEYGIEVYDANGMMLSSEEIVRSFTEGLNGLSEAQRNAALDKIFGSDGGRAARVIFKGTAEDFIKAKDAVTEFGAAAKLTESRTKGLPGSLDAMASSLETLGTNLGNAATKPVAELAETVTKLANAFADLPEGTQETIIRLGMLAIAAGPAVTVLGGVTKAAGGMIGFLPKVVGGVKDLGAAVSLIKGGAGVRDTLSALTVGTSGIGFAAAAAAVSLTAMWLSYQKNIVDMNQAGKEAVSTALTDQYQKIITDGGTATEVMASYNWQVQNLKNNQVGLAAAFVDWNGVAENSLSAVSTALLATTTSFDEYQKLVMQAFDASGLAANSSEWAKADESGRAFDTMIRKSLALSQADYELARAEVAAGGSAQVVVAGLTNTAGAALDASGGLNALSAEAQTYMSGLDALGEAQQRINADMSNWVQGAASQAVSSLSGLNVESDRYLQGLKAVDEVMGTQYYQQQLLTNTLNTLGEEFQKTGDVEAFRAGMEKAKDEGLKPFYDQLEDVTIKAQDLYDRLTGLPSEVLINVKFNVEGEPNWAGLGIDTSGNPGGTVKGNEGVSVYSQASGGDWWVTKPTLFLAGDAGAERATFTPAGKEAAGGDVIVNILPGAIQVAAKSDLDIPWMTKLMAAGIAQEIRRRRL